VIAAPPTSRTSDATLLLAGSPPQTPPSSRVSADRARPQLLHRVARGDLAAVQTCMNRFGAMVWSMARRFSASREDAEDAVQEIFTELWRNAERYDPDQSSEEAFVAMIAWRRLVDRLRAAKRQPPTESLAPHLEISSPAEPSNDGFTDSAALERALEKLRPEQRDVLLFATREGLSQQQIASRMGLALGTVKTHARRGLMKLRALLFDNDPTSEGIPQ
jgi:RNA polymerase sigma factor (sigma-70 family)